MNVKALSRNPARSHPTIFNVAQKAPYKRCRVAQVCFSKSWLVEESKALLEEVVITLSVSKVFILLKYFGTRATS